MIELINEIIIPNFCIECSKPGVKICNHCREKILFMEYQPCVICEGLTFDGKTHLICKNSNKYAPEKSLSTYIYGGVVRKIILMSKKSFKPSNLLDILIRDHKFINDISNFKDANYVVSIPSGKLFGQKTNSATEYIASTVSKILNIENINLFKSNPVAEKQKHLDKLSRFSNVKENLRISPKYLDIYNFDKLPPDLINKTFLVVDDVSTSGASILYASYLLKEAGAKKVHAYVLAKDLRYNQ